jgi:hypothetical protein
MRIVALTALVSALLLAVAVRSGAQAETNALVDKALKAMGNAEQLVKVRAATVKGSGKFHTPGDLMFTLESSMQRFDSYHIDMVFDINGNKVTQTIVLHGGKGWLKIGDNNSEMSQDQYEGFRDSLYAVQLATLPMALKDKSFKLSALGDINVADRPAAGLLVSRKDRRDVNLYFDKETGLPVKCETTAKDLFTAQEVSNEFLFSDYRPFDGVKSYSKLAWKKDGKLYLEQEITEVKLHERLADEVFAQP